MTDTHDAMTDWVMAGLFMTAAVAVVWYFPLQWLLDPTSPVKPPAGRRGTSSA